LTPTFCEDAGETAENDQNAEDSFALEEAISLDDCLKKNGFCSVKDDDGKPKSVKHDGVKYYVIKDVAENEEEVYSLILASEFDKM